MTANSSQSPGPSHWPNPSLWHGGAPLLLASASAIRAKILLDAGIPVETRPAQIDERALERGLGAVSPPMIANALAAAKALSVSAPDPERLVLGADQTLALGDDIFHKPRTLDEASRHLARLSGREHQLHSALALARGGKVIWSHVETARLKMRALSSDFIALYLSTAGEIVLSSVGAYQVEALGAHLFESVEGDHTTIMGLPLPPLLAAMRNLGLVAR